MLIALALEQPTSVVGFTNRRWGRNGGNDEFEWIHRMCRANALIKYLQRKNDRPNVDGFSFFVPFRLKHERIK